MKKYLKYFTLFVILILIGVVCVNIYNNKHFSDENQNSVTTLKKEDKTSDKDNTKSVQDNDNKVEVIEEKKEENSEENKKNDDNSSSGEGFVSDSSSQDDSSLYSSSSVQSPVTNLDADDVDDFEEDDSSIVSSEEKETYGVIDASSSSQEGAVLDSNQDVSIEGNNVIEVDNSDFSSEQQSENLIEDEVVVSSQGTESSEVVTSSDNQVKSTTSKKTTQSSKVKDGSIVGATGYVAISSKSTLYSKASVSSKNLTKIKVGFPFKILGKSKDGKWWKVNYKGTVGYVENAYCLINLPDYIPSIKYSITNANKSIYRSSGVNLSVYGKKLYNTGKVYNERLGRNEYIVPVTYNLAKKILKAQRSALKDGYSLRIYDAYRPASVEKLVRESLNSLYNSNSTVKKNVDCSYDANGNCIFWGQAWFMSQSLSSHSLAAAIDVTLTKDGKNLKMPSKMDELSTKSVKYQYGVDGQTTVRKDLYSSNMTSAAKKLDAYMLNAGLTNLASEWWHFQDNVSYNQLRAIESSGFDFQPKKIVSSK